MAARQFLNTLVGEDLGLPLVVQSCVYMGLLLLNSYLGTLLALVIGGISLAILLIALAVELIEPSRVPRSYFRFMMSAWLAPLISLLTFTLLRGDIEWLNL
ncbi:MAG: hypothetical protein AAFY36_04375 [Bacteroidota bacterium]